MVSKMRNLYKYYVYILQIKNYFTYVINLLPMDRDLYTELLEWKDSDDRKPLMIMGPRQVGKTYSAIQFARENYSHYVLFNFQESIKLHRIFEEDLDPYVLLKELSAYSQ